MSLSFQVALWVMSAPGFEKPSICLTSHSYTHIVAFFYYLFPRPFENGSGAYITHNATTEHNEIINVVFG